MKYNINNIDDAIDVDKQIEFVFEQVESRDIYFLQSEPCRLTVSFWTLNTLKLLRCDRKESKHFERYNKYKQNVLSYAIECYESNISETSSASGFSPHPTHPQNVTSTLSGIQIFYLCDYTDFDPERIRRYLTSNFIENSNTLAFMNDEFGDVDTRIDCCVVVGLYLLECLDAKCLDAKTNAKNKLKELLQEKYEKFITHLLMCYNFDGGFGQVEGGESHAAQCFCCLSCLDILGETKRINLEKCKEFLEEKQFIETILKTNLVESNIDNDIINYENKNKNSLHGGLMGRVNKKVDVCYSYWVYAAYKIIETKLKENSKEEEVTFTLDKDALIQFILRCQSKNGGFSDRPGNVSDVYHQMFALAALSLLDVDSLNKIDVLASL